jgi:hypothetical protein
MTTSDKTSVICPKKKASACIQISHGPSALEVSMKFLIFGRECWGIWGVFVRCSMCNYVHFGAGLVSAMNRGEGWGGRAFLHAESTKSAS